MALAGRDDLRPVVPDALHVTLVFLGPRPAEMVEAIARAALGAIAGRPSPRLRFGAVRAVSPRRPRLFALDLEDAEGRATALARAAGGALEAAGLFRPERRPFWPHVTFARVRGGRMAPALEAAPPAGVEPFRAEQVTLYRSVLGRGGARYEPLERLVLGGG